MTTKMKARQAKQEQFAARTARRQLIAAAARERLAREAFAQANG